MVSKAKASRPSAALDALVAKAKTSKKVTQAALGRHLFLSERSVREAFAKGVFPDTVDSKALTEADFDVCREAYIKHLRDQAAGRAKEPVGDANDPDDPAIQMARTSREQRKLIIVKRQKMENLLIDRADMILAVSAAFARVKSSLLRFPKKSAKRLAVMEDEIEIREYLLDEINFALTELASTPVEEIGLKGQTEDGGDSTDGTD